MFCLGLVVGFGDNLGEFDKVWWFVYLFCNWVCICWIDCFYVGDNVLCRLVVDEFYSFVLWFWGWFGNFVCELMGWRNLFVLLCLCGRVLLVVWLLGFWLMLYWIFNVLYNFCWNCFVLFCYWYCWYRYWNCLCIWFWGV